MHRCLPCCQRLCRWDNELLLTLHTSNLLWLPQVVEANADWVPPQGKGSLYLRPLLIGSGPILGLGPAPAYTLVRNAAAAAAAAAAVAAVAAAAATAARMCGWVGLSPAPRRPPPTPADLAGQHVVRAFSGTDMASPHLHASSPQVVYCASVGAYFKGGQLTPIDLIVEEHFHR